MRDYYNGGEEKEVFAGQEEFWSVVLIVSVCLCVSSVAPVTVRGDRVRECHMNIIN